MIDHWHRKHAAIRVVNPVARAMLMERKRPQVVPAKKGNKAKRNRQDEFRRTIKEQMELYLSPWAAQYDSELGIPDYSMQAGVGAGMATNVKALATEQAYLEMEADDEMFADFCGFMFGEAAGETSNRFNLGVASFQELRKNFDRLKLCGLLDMMVEGIQCLFSGLSLDAALGKMIEAALSKMSGSLAQNCTINGRSYLQAVKYFCRIFFVFKNSLA